MISYIPNDERFWVPFGFTDNFDICVDICFIMFPSESNRDVSGAAAKDCKEVLSPTNFDLTSSNRQICYNSKSLIN